MNPTQRHSTESQNQNVFDNIKHIVTRGLTGAVLGTNTPMHRNITHTLKENTRGVVKSRCPHIVLRGSLMTMKMMQIS